MAGGAQMPPPSVLAHTPAASHVPQGVTPNFTNPYSENGIFFGVCTTLEVIMLLFVAMRIKAKWNNLKRLQLDDYLCLVGALLTTGVYIIYSYCVTESKYGAHYWNVSILFLESDKFAIPTWLSTWFLSPAYCFVKVTFFVMYLSIFKPFLWLRILSYIGIFWVIGTYFSVFIVQLYAESPKPGESFGAAFQDPKYILSERTAVPLASLGLAIDIAILLLPLAGVSRLQMSAQKKIGVGAVFATGLIACIASAIGLNYRVKLGSSLNDLTWATFPVYVTACVECQVGVICSCMPASSSLVRNGSGLLSSLRDKSTRSISRLIGRSSASGSHGSTSRSHYNDKSKDMDVDSDSLHDDSSGVNSFKKPSYDIEMQGRSLSPAIPPKALDPNNVSITQGFEQYSTPRSALRDSDLLRSPLDDRHVTAR